MTSPDMTILYVDNPTESAAFYGKLLGAPPVQARSGFAMFALPKGTMLGLWARHDIDPPPASPGDAGELAFPVADVEALEAAHAAWIGLGVTILQAPTRMPWGLAFLATDPDGHRLRVFAPTGR